MHMVGGIVIKSEKRLTMPVFKGIILALALALVCNGCGLADALTLPEHIVSIGSEAFAGNTAITAFIIPEGAVSIDERAFAESGLTEITLPSTLTAIADDAFDGCAIAVAHAPWGSYAFEYCRAKGWLVKTPWSPEFNIATYNGEAFKVVNTPMDPFTCAEIMYDRLCTHPQGTDKYEGKCMNFAYYYIYCMADNITDVNISTAKRNWIKSKKYNYDSGDKYSDPNIMIARLYDLLSAGVPQILMVEAITHPGSRHFVTVVGHRASVTRREDLRPEDLLIIDSFDGKLESMDPAIEPVDTRVLFKQSGKYRIEALTPKS